MSGKAAFFDEMAHRWDETVRGDARMRAMLDTLHVEPSAAILDVGVGTGRTVLYLLGRLGSEGRLVAVDISSEMLRRAREKVCDGRVTFVQADASRLPEELEGFAMILCHGVFPHFDDPQATLCVLARRLAAGGLLVVAHDISRERVNRIHSEHGGVTGKDYLPSGEELRPLFAQAMLDVERVEDDDDHFLMTGRRVGSATAACA